MFPSASHQCSRAGELPQDFSLGASPELRAYLPPISEFVFASSSHKCFVPVLSRYSPRYTAVFGLLDEAGEGVSAGREAAGVLFGERVPL